MPQPGLIDQLLTRLNSGIASAPELEQALGVSQSSMSRILRRLVSDARVLRIGSTRGARYGLRRGISGIGSSWPLRRIDRAGALHNFGQLHALAAGEYYFEPSQQARTEDFPQRVVDWNDEHYLRYLTTRGSDSVGDLILGSAAFDDYLALQRARNIIPADERSSQFPQLVDQVMAGGLPGSSAHGEHPKFAIVVQDPGGARHVLVKFSPSIGTAVGQRWSDLLIAEHQAHQVLRAAGIAAADSRIFRIDDRTYLEVDRFDRDGLEGRVGVSSLMAIDANLYGNLDNWIAAGQRLRTDRRIDDKALERIQLVTTFGALIANTDRHFGNLAFYDSYTGRFELAPVYDMLPMLFAPEHDQIIAHMFQPPGPTSDTLLMWPRARALAEGYWRALTGDPRIGADFREIAGACLLALEALPRTGAYAYHISELDSPGA
ncbi:MAG: hypothetical protein E6K48_00860 [Gammaproteobacteria bacterium]|nr:MAG: hypothetical protein E6K48_00860 [Gammaproteobacteria bacterium]